MRRDFDCPRVTVIVPYPAGGAPDVAARLVADRLELGLKKSFVIENRPGATGNIGTAAVVNAKPDGCTLLVNAAVLATFPSSFSKLGFDPVKDLAPIGGIGVTPTLLVAPKSLPADDLKGLVQLSKQRPDGLSFSTAGYGLLQHLAVEEMAQRTGAQVRARGLQGRRAGRDRSHRRARRFRQFRRRLGDPVREGRRAQAAGRRPGHPLGPDARGGDDRRAGAARPRRRRSFHAVRARGDADGRRFRSSTANSTRSSAIRP